MFVKNQSGPFPCWYGSLPKLYQWTSHTQEFLYIFLNFLKWMLRRDVGINVHTNTWDRWKPTTTQSWFNKLKEFDRSNLGVWYLAEYFLILLTPLILHYRNDIHRSQVIRGFCYWNIYWHPIKSEKILNDEVVCKLLHLFWCSQMSWSLCE